MQTRRLGDLDVSAIGLGGMPLSRPGRSGELPDRAQAIATVHKALDLGVTFIDTADAYAPDFHQQTAGAGEGLGHNEDLIAEALRGRSEEVLVATKAGMTRDGDKPWPTNGDPAWIRQAVEGSLARLGVESIGLYQHHRPDPEVAYADTIGAFKELHDAGKVQRVGLSNANPDQIREAHGILGNALVSVQNQYSPSFRSSEPELRLCEELGLAFLPWSPLGGMKDAHALGSGFATFAEVAAKHDASPQQVCIAWMLATSPNIIPIPGASRPESITDTSRAVHLELTPEDVAALS